MWEENGDGWCIPTILLVGTILIWDGLGGEIGMNQFWGWFSDLLRDWYEPILGLVRDWYEPVLGLVQEHDTKQDILVGVHRLAPWPQKSRQNV